MVEGKVPGVDFPSGFPAGAKDRQGEFHGETLQAVAEGWFAKFEHSWKPGHARTIPIRLGQYIYEVLGAIPIQDITSPGVLKLFRAVDGLSFWKAGHSLRAYEGERKLQCPPQLREG